MSRSTLMIVAGGLVVAGATILGTRYVLGLFPSSSPTPAAEEASFLAHLLLPLSISLLIIVSIVLVGGVVRLVRSISRRDPRDGRDG